jgi:hypothetical protein
MAKRKELGIHDPGENDPRRCWALVQAKGGVDGETRNCLAHSQMGGKHTCLWHTKREPQVVAYLTAQG